MSKPIALALALAGVPLLVAPACSPRDGASAPEAEAFSVETDARLRPLFENCIRSGFYDVDTSDVVGVQIEILKSGQLAPLKRAKMELAATEEAYEDVRRLLERKWLDPAGENFVRNALDVASLSEWPGARELLVRCLAHPVEGVRTASLYGIGKHGDASDYDAVRDLVNSAGLEVLGLIGPVLHDLDPGRAEIEYIEWYREGVRGSLWESVGPRVAATRRRRTLDEIRKVLDEAPPRQMPYFATALANNGDRGQLEVLRALLRDESNDAQRGLTIRAMAEAGLVDELLYTLQNDPHPSFRALAAGAFAKGDVSDERIAHLLGGSSDPDPGVRLTCLKALAGLGERSSLELGLALLSEKTHESLNSGLQILKDVFEEEGELAREAFERLKRRDEELAHLPLAERAQSLHALGLVPVGDAAAYLHGIAREAQGEIQKMRAHRWLMLRAGNAGEAGREYLARAYDAETDPRRRIDLLEGFTAGGGDLGRERVLDWLGRGEVPPHELVYLADRLVRMGPARQILPVLKRVCRRIEEPAARRAMQCLLWYWYPEPRLD